MSQVRALDRALGRVPLFGAAAERAAIAERAARYAAPAFSAERAVGYAAPAFSAERAGRAAGYAAPAVPLLPQPGRPELAEEFTASSGVRVRIWRVRHARPAHYEGRR